MESYICEFCRGDLRAAVIPNTNPPEYYSRVIGVEVAGVYDGVLYWECPHCQGKWHRFREGTDLYRKAEVYVREKYHAT